MMALCTRTNPAELSEIAHGEDIPPMELMEAAANDGIITDASDFYGPGKQAPECLHLAGSVADFEIYVQQLAVSSR